MAKTIQGDWGFILFALLLALVPRPAWGQADAAAEFQTGKQAFAAGRFAQARDALTAASQTDPRNPEVFLWLGKADYQLGDLDAAIAAWKATQALAPNEPYSAAMLKTLTSQSRDAQTTLALIDVLLQNEFFDKAHETADRLLEDKALTDSQRARAMTQRAAALLGEKKPAEAAAAIEDLLLRYPKQADPEQIALLLAKAKLPLGGAKSAQAVGELKKLAADHPNTPAGIEAAYELIAFDLEQDVDAHKVDALAIWVAAHPDVREADRARRRLIEAYFTLTNQSGPARPDAPLKDADKAALAIATQLYSHIALDGDAYELTIFIRDHLETYYARSNAFAAAITGAELLLKAPLPARSREVALWADVQYRDQFAQKQLSDEARAGRLTGPAMPQALIDAIAALHALQQQSSSPQAWYAQGELAEQAREIGATVPWPAEISGLKPAYAWAVEIALPVVKANADATSVERAAKTIDAVVSEVAHAQPPGSRLALDVNEQLLAALPDENPEWITAMWRQADLLDALARAEFNQNIQSGHAETNAKLSPTQEQLLSILLRIVARDAAQAQPAIERLQGHLEPWLAAGYFDVAEQAFARLATAVPEAQARGLQLQIVNLWVKRAFDEDQRLAAAGLAVPHRIDDVIAKALKRLYELQAAVAQTDPFLGQVRSVIDRIIGHFNELGYYDIAEGAAKVKSAPAVPMAEAYAQFELARLSDDAARRELAELLKHYKASDQLALTDSTKTAIAAWEQFVTDHPADPLVSTASSAVFALAGLYEQYGAFDVAQGIYAAFSAFASKVPVLAQALPGRISISEQASFQAVGSLDLKAHAAFAKQLADQQGKPTPPQPPVKISDEFAASVAEYRDFIKAHPESPLVGNAIQRIMVAALDYARADAWDVADGIFASVLGGPRDALPIRDPERLEFCRGMCQVGKVMPEHAKEILGTLAAGAAQTNGGALFGGGSGGDDSRATAEDKLELGSVSTITAPMSISGSGSLDLKGQVTHGMGTVAGMVTINGGGLTVTGGSSPAAAATPALQPTDELRARADTEVLAAISQQEARRASQVAALRDADRPMNGPEEPYGANRTRQVAQQMEKSAKVAEPLPALSKEELARQQLALDAAYVIFQSIRTQHARTASTDQARAEIMLAISYWRGIGQPQRGAALAQRFLKDNPADAQLPQIRLGIAQDELAWASVPVEEKSNQEMLAEVSRRFNEARASLAKVVADFPEDRALGQDAQWQIATSFLTQARAVGAFSPTLARGQYARAAKELDKVAVEYADHPQIASIPNMLWQIAAELQQRGYADEAIAVWSDLAVHYPTQPLAAQAVELVAQTYQNTLGRPLRAAEIYVEINFARGGNDINVQNAVFNIGSQLSQEKRWVEALHVLQLFVDSFPHHPSAGQGLAMIGQIHQANESWPEAMAAYQRVINEYPEGGSSVQEAKWSIADCIINLSKWQPAIEAYESYVAAFPGDGRVGEANRRISVLKDLANYQTLVNENGPKAFDAQFQIAQLVQTQLNNTAKAIVEYQKVATNYPKSHLAPEALHAIGMILLQDGDMDRARAVLHSVADLYPDSPLADAALFQVGKSYEDEAQQLAGLNRDVSLGLNGIVAQNNAYRWAMSNTTMQRANQSAKLSKARETSKKDEELQLASNAAGNAAFDQANTDLAAAQATQSQAELTAAQLADRQDKINAALRQAVAAYTEASRVPGGDRAGEALLRMAVIYSEKLGEPQEAMATWLEIVRQFSGTSVAEEASWQIAQDYERAGKYAEAVEAYKNFLRNYRRSPKAAEAQFFIAENYEHLGEWVSAMDQYTNYLNNWPEGGLAQKAREQISFIKTYRI